MLFNSYQFIFIFLPSVAAAYFIFSRFGRTARLTLLFTASLLFYGWWNARLLALLVFSMIANFLIGRRLSVPRPPRQTRTAGFWLAFGVGLNLLVLGAFKYANFFAANVDLLTGTHLSFGSIILPLGISFFTFEQIGYLVDIKRGHRYPADPLSYAVFVSFFPRLVAGPILRYSEIEPQLAPTASPRFSVEDLAIGLTIFFIGLAKKSFLADGVAPYVLPGFTAAQTGHVEFFTAWGSVLAYTFQLYFDFSGYSDMAIGAARCFGIVFPLNFASPYKSVNIVEFWRRWHITLSRFLRDYLYIPLGGNRNGKLRRYSNLLLTMLLGGLWHGANWTFVCWGGLHGIYLIINHGWDMLARRASLIAHLRATACWRLTAWFLTFTAVVVGWVFFRSPDFTTALRLLDAMIGANGADLPNALLSLPEPVRRALSSIGVHFGFGSGTTLVSTYLWVVALLFITLIMPNTQELLARFNPALAGPETVQPAGYGRWSLSPGWAVAFGAIAFLGIISITRVSEFLYWQF